MLYNITFELQEDKVDEWIDRLFDDLGDHNANVTHRETTMRALTLTEVWGVLSYIAEDGVPIKNLTVEVERATPDVRVLPKRRRSPEDLPPEGRVLLEVTHPSGAGMIGSISDEDYRRVEDMLYTMRARWQHHDRLRAVGGQDAQARRRARAQADGVPALHQEGGTEGMGAHGIRGLVLRDSSRTREARMGLRRDVGGPIVSDGGECWRFPEHRPAAVRHVPTLRQGGGRRHPGGDQAGRGHRGG